MGWARTRWFNHILKDIERGGEKLVSNRKRKIVGRMEKLETFHLYKMEMTMSYRLKQ
jgi:hypothetical protein